ncbi:hypothetical protein [Streptomyces sp. RFCAC02]|uniref:hypothetical protein n=1 Tax=Streptomyces sp. RFCAC02 TaxID=2499143 RepID=UPI001F0EFA03|nr:hypothetical protein [Streptomyces sp. RFCAC02]
MIDPLPLPEIPTTRRVLPDPLTPHRDITHEHFRPGEQIVVIRGVARGKLWGDAMRVVAPSWHTPTDEAGWRLRDPDGGQHSYVTAHPRYLVHVRRRCADCLIHLRALQEHLRPRTAREAVVDAGWYARTSLDQLVHIADR